MNTEIRVYHTCSIALRVAVNCRGLCHGGVRRHGGTTAQCRDLSTSHLPVKSSAWFLPGLISPEVRLSSFPSDHGHGAEKNVLTFAH